LTASVIAIIFRRQLVKPFVLSLSKMGGRDRPYPSWQINQDANFVLLTYIPFALESALALTLNIIILVSPALSERVFALGSLYEDNIRAYALFVWLLAIAPFGLKLLYYLFYAPILVTNQFTQPVTIFILGRRVGIVSPGHTIRNNRVFPKYDSYLIEARDATGIIYSNEFDKEELDRIDWKVIVSQRDGKA